MYGTAPGWILDENVKILQMLPASSFPYIVTTWRKTELVTNIICYSVKEFEYTPECVVFDLLNISLFHGWLVDTGQPEAVRAVGNLTYNQLVEMVIENQGSTNVDKSTQGGCSNMCMLQ